MDKNMSKAEKIGTAAGAAASFLAAGPAATPFGAGAGYAAGKAVDSFRSRDDDSKSDD